jgi:hypothetical protein
MPSVTTWNRIEPRCRSFDLQAALEARVHDPLWLLARQWQVGEFEGRNAGSPVMATVQCSIAPFDRFSVAGQTPQVYDVREPIEVLVEQEAVWPLNAAGDYRQATEAGLYFLRLLNAAQLPPTIWSSYLALYPLSGTAGNAQTISSIVAGRVIDGIKLHADLLAAGSNLPSLPAVPATQHDSVLKVTRDWLAWYATLFSEPAQTVGWLSDRMEYSFAMGAAAGTDSYTAQEYDGGAVDWYTFDRSAKPLAGGTLQPSTRSISFIATPVTFRGMPARRFWEMEDAATDIGQLSAAAEDLGRLLLREFVLIYGNDWFQFPLPVPVGSKVDITSLSVADTFGVTTVIPHYSTFDGALGNWRMFRLSADSSDGSTLSPAAALPHPLLITPGGVAPIDGSAVEEVLLLRDELANMAWGIERTVPGASGQPLDRTTAWNTNLPIAPPPAPDAVPLYRLGSDIPDYWLPFLLVPGTDSKGPMTLQRGKLPTSPTGPLGRMLADSKTIFLEEVPREGVLLERRYRCARGLDGAVYLWMGRQRSIGTGEGRSGLRFDFLE